LSAGVALRARSRNGLDFGNAALVRRSMPTARPPAHSAPYSSTAAERDDVMDLNNVTLIGNLVRDSEAEGPQQRTADRQVLLSDELRLAGRQHEGPAGSGRLPRRARVGALRRDHSPVRQEGLEGMHRGPTSKYCLHWQGRAEAHARR